MQRCPVQGVVEEGVADGEAVPQERVKGSAAGAALLAEPEDVLEAAADWLPKLGLGSITQLSMDSLKVLHRVITSKEKLVCHKSSCPGRPNVR